MSSSGPPVDHPRCNQVHRLRRESRPRFAAPSYRRREAEPLADAGVNIHIDADGLIRDNRERLRLGADMFACAALHIQNIGAWRQRSAIFSIPIRGDRKSTRLNSSHVAISYAVFCLKKKNNMLSYF